MTKFGMISGFSGLLLLFIAVAFSGEAAIEARTNAPTGIMLGIGAALLILGAILYRRGTRNA